MAGRLNEVDLNLVLAKTESERQLARLQRRLLHLELVSSGLLGGGPLGPGVCVVLEGWDAAGKGGAIKRLVAMLDPRHVHVAGFAAPTVEEKAHHFLWRFWPHLPGRGDLAVFDRSWYGRVLVERVEGFATPAQVERAYDEIVAFETSLAEEATTIVKLWLEISPEEQLRRFNSRQSDPLRSWKLTDEDWRNRAKRDEYVPAAEAMFARTDHHRAHWHLIAAESKHYARVAVLTTVIRALERDMVRLGCPVPPEEPDSAVAD